MKKNKRPNIALCGRPASSGTNDEHRPLDTTH